MISVEGDFNSHNFLIHGIIFYSKEALSLNRKIQKRRKVSHNFKFYLLMGWLGLSFKG